MRITGGSLKNRQVECPKGIIRPAMDRMRESVFSILGDLSGLSFLDLFTGSGVCGLEAYSRGAYPVYLVEKDADKFPVLLKNVSMADKKLECKRMPAETFIKRAKESFDIIYLDPPFPYKFHIELLEKIAESKILKEGGLVMMHRPSEKAMPQTIGSLTKSDERVYGRSIVDFYRKKFWEEMMFKLKENFLLGVATASTQIEGGRVNSNWNDFCDRKMTNDGSDVARANMHYEKVKEDTKLLKKMGIQTYRMSLEWARIEPEKGKFDTKAIDHYKEELSLLKKAGIRPLISLYHFSHPMWFENSGGFTKKENVEVFLNYVKTCISALGNLCSDYVTINEPNVYAVQSFFLGLWPPEKKSIAKTLKVMNILIAAHCKAYDLIHEIRKEKGLTDTRVSFAHHMQAFHPKDKNRKADQRAAKRISKIFQDGIMEACFKGEFSFPFKNILNIKKKNYVDFIAINYYSRQAVRGLSYKAFENTPKNDLGWDIYPLGLIECAQTCYNCLPLPIVISENGTCDNKDEFRCRYIYDHLKLISESPLPFEAYYHWCFIDNFEWKEGESARFGLVHCNYETQERTIKKSGEFYSKMIKKRGVDKSMVEKYVEPCKYNVK